VVELSFWESLDDYVEFVRRNPEKADYENWPFLHL